MPQPSLSCGKSGKRETPQTRTRRGGSRPARGKRRLVRKSTAVFNKERFKKCELGLPFLTSFYWKYTINTLSIKRKRVFAYVK
ncbi:MAG: hypothetical protein LPK00_04705 [Bacillaceae bacterium]|nr:hypothetical protein [Bacillaceae bacterium]